MYVEYFWYIFNLLKDLFVAIFLYPRNTKCSYNRLIPEAGFLKNLNSICELEHRKDNGCHHGDYLTMVAKVISVVRTGPRDIVHVKAGFGGKNAKLWSNSLPSPTHACIG